MTHAPRRYAALFACTILLGGAAHAAVERRGAQAYDAAREAAAPVAAALRPTLETFAGEPAYVYEGQDVDGDGAADFANPTGAAPRDHDGYGHGHFGASRGGGVRRHAGVDYVSEAGQTVVAPISGYVTKIGHPYADGELRYVEIANPALKLTARVFYVDPDVAVGDTVRLGDSIGEAATLQDRYAGITDHVHLEISRGGRKVDAETVIVARLETGGRG